MDIKIYESPKGYMIYLVDNRVTIAKYFLRDDKHCLLVKYIPSIIQSKQFVLGAPFGDNRDIYPIVVFDYSILQPVNIPVNIPEKYCNTHNLSTFFKRRAIWDYYRALVQGKNNKPRLIKYWANELKYNLRELGIDKLYILVTQGFNTPSGILTKLI